MVFDYRVIGTEVWEGILRRTKGNVGDRVSGERDGVDRDDGEKDEEWKRYFCGRLEIGIVVVEGGEDDGEGTRVQYNAYGEMIWK